MARPDRQVSCERTGRPARPTLGERHLRVVVVSGFEPVSRFADRSAPVDADATPEPANRAEATAAPRGARRCARPDTGRAEAPMPVCAEHTAPSLRADRGLPGPRAHLPASATRPRLDEQMTRVRPLASLALMLVLSGCDLFDPKSDGSDGPSASDPTTDLARVALQAHDQVRGQRQPRAQPGAAGRCSGPPRWRPSQPGGRRTASTSTTPAAGTWGRTSPRARPGTGRASPRSCRPGPPRRRTTTTRPTAAPREKVCGHYTQLVWRNSTLLGCAYARCTSNSPFQGVPTWDFWVCDYSPPGNWVGQRPY